MKKLQMVGLCLGYGLLDLYLLLGWFAASQPQRPGLWQKIYGPLTFDLSGNPDGLGITFLLLSGLATVAFMIGIIRLTRSTPPPANDNPFTGEG